MTTLTGKEFADVVRAENQALFDASRLNVREYFDSKPSQEELVAHFTGRMVNERMNMVEISAAVAAMPASTPVQELELLTKQAQDEALHFRMVKDVIEHITGEELDVEAAIEAEAAKPTAKGADLLASYEASTDAAALAAYQLVAEGRAEAVWQEMADCIEDEYISKAYAKIARDEGFHANIGGLSLAKLAVTAEEQSRIQGLVDQMRKDLFNISCMNTTVTAEAKELVSEAYGW
jgi:transcriptional regulator of met regulon